MILSSANPTLATQQTGKHRGQYVKILENDCKGNGPPLEMVLYDAK